MDDAMNIKCKFAYKCGICGAEYSSVLDRAKCEIACSERVAAEAKAAEEAKKKEEQKMRKEAVDEEFERLHRMLTDYVNDYGHYEYGNDYFNWPSKF